MTKIIMGIQLQKRHETAIDVQAVLSQFGCYINTRIGLHQGTKESCNEEGLIILEFIEDADKEAYDFEKALSKIENVVIKRMEF